MNIGDLNISRMISHLATIASKAQSSAKAFGVNLGAAIQSTSSAPALRTNSSATANIKTNFQSFAGQISLAESISEEQGIIRTGNAQATGKEVKRKLSETTKAESESIYNEVTEETLSADTEEGGAGDQETGQEGAGAGNKNLGGERSKAGGKQMVELLENLDPNKPIQEQIDQYLTDPAWKTESAQAKIGQFIYDHLDKMNEAALVNRVKAHVDKHTETAVRKALQKELASKGVTPELQQIIDAKFSEYFNLVSTETTLAPDEIKFMNEYVINLPIANREELPASFRGQLQHQIGLSMRKFDTFDDRAQFLVCNAAIKLTRAITLLFKDFEMVIPRLEKQGLTKLSTYIESNDKPPSVDTNRANNPGTDKSSARSPNVNKSNKGN